MGWYVGFARGCPDMIGLWIYKFILIISAGIKKMSITWYI
jgi:hypothetical protein